MTFKVFTCNWRCSRIQGTCQSHWRRIWWRDSTPGSPACCHAPCRCSDPPWTWWWPINNYCMNLAPPTNEPVHPAAVSTLVPELAGVCPRLRHPGQLLVPCELPAMFADDEVTGHTAGHLMSEAGGCRVPPVATRDLSLLCSSSASCFSACVTLPS